MRRGFSVTGAAESCGPCALSAVTGLSSESWPDVAMTVDELAAAIVEAGN